MDLDRSNHHHHRQSTTPTTTTTTSSSTSTDLFICFTSRLTNTSMRLSNPPSSKPSSSSSIHSPGRTTDTTNKPHLSSSLSASLTRRLRTSRNGSLRGGAQSPMFPPGTVKKKGCGSTFDNPEPSSPKVTCIGQVRVKTKKQGKKMKMNMRACRSKRRNGSGGGSVDPSFRRSEGLLSRQTSRRVYQYQQNRVEDDDYEDERRRKRREREGEAVSGCLQSGNQRWVHLPMSICDALKAFDCLIPCKSSCFSDEQREKTEIRDYHQRNRREGSNSTSSSSCGGGVFRWLVALHEGEGKARDIELVMGGEEENRVHGERRESVVMERECSRRRSIFDDMDFEEICGGNESKKDESNSSAEKEEEEEEEEEAGRVSHICVPPKNALLLMRCRSDPVKMAALANRFWESPVRKLGDEEENNDDDEIEEDWGGHEEERHRLSVGIKEAKVHDVEMIEKKDIRKGEVGRKVKSLPSSPPQREEEKEVMMTMMSGYNNKIAKVIDFEEKGSSNLQQQVVVDTTGGEIGEDELSELVLRLFDCYLLEQEKAELITESHEFIERPEEKSTTRKDPNFEQNGAGNLGLSTEAASSSIEEEDRFNRGETTLQEKKKRSEQHTTSSEEGSELKPARENVTATTATTTTTEVEVEVEEIVEQKEKEGAAAETTERKSSSSSSDPSNIGGGGLPDCLLLMMCEPKLSMEVSKETWVRTTDFIRWLPERHRQHHLKKVKPMEDDTTTEKQKSTTSIKTTATIIKEDDNPNPNLKKKSTRPPKFPTESESKVVVLPGRSSCSFPVGVAKQYGRGNGGGERKMVGRGGGGYEPLGLTRCKSAPMRSATAKLAGAAAAAAAKQGDLTVAACAWKNKRMEPHRAAAAAATCGVGGAVGF